MIASQRKAHKVIWLAIAMVMPVLIFFSIKNLEFITPIGQTQDRPQILVELIANETSKAIIVTLDKAFSSPSSVIYEIDAEGQLGKVLGQFQNKGTYKFLLSDNATGISIVDTIKNRNIYTTTF